MKHPEGDGVTLQINLAPGDWRLAEHLLPHQVRTWRGQVSEILITVDLHRSEGRFATDWEAGRDRILEIARSVEGATVLPIDYGEAARERVAKEFFGGAPVPPKDFRGGPYYAYFFGLNSARNNWVFHTDSDILYGGGSHTWMAEAVAYADRHPEVLVSAPLPGPPADNGRLRYLAAVPDPTEPHAHLLDAMSTRVFLIDRRRFHQGIGALEPLPPPAWKSRIKALVEGNPVADLPEHLVTGQMRRRGLTRRDFLGSSPGMWTLHPPFRGADFYAKLPALVQLVEAGSIPVAQRGDHDLNASLVDWSEPLAALRRNRWWRRLLKRAK